MKRLEEDSIGRPSTYAPTIATIQKRGYVFRQGKALVPSFTAFAVTTLLRDHFGDYVDVGFTAKMEEDLDEISNGERDWLDFLRAFYRDGDGERRGLEGAVSDEEATIAYPLIDVGIDADNGQPIHVRVGRFGPFLQQGEGGPGHTASLPLTLPPADLTVQKAMAILRAKAEGPRLLGVDATAARTSTSSTDVSAPTSSWARRRNGVTTEKPRRSSLTSGLSESTVTIDQALKLLSLPRELGRHPESGQPILAGLGRYGPYVKHGDDFRSLESEDDLFTVDSRAGWRCSPRRRSRGAGAARPGASSVKSRPPTAPRPCRCWRGGYGPYVTTERSTPRCPGARTRRGSPSKRPAT